MKALITGSSGLVGGYLCNHLRESGFEVDGVSRHDDHGLTWDMLNFEKISNQKSNKNYDIVIHVAAANEVDCLAHPALSYAINVAGTRAVIEFCKLNKINTLIYISTAQVFGMCCDTITESVEPNPVNTYGQSHLMAEQLLRLVAREGSLKVGIIRVGNLFGFPANLNLFKRWTLAPYDFYKQAAKNFRIELKTDGSGKRSFVSLQFLANSIMNLILGGNLPILTHIGGGMTISIKDLALKTSKLCQYYLNKEIPVIVKKSENNASSNYSFISEVEIFNEEITVAEFQYKNFIESMVLNDNKL
ncbi:NAD(P)-dependent oxidoreductase [Polynucleobacter sp. es-MAR-4]|uniref:NAD-dependent epimerase/dehydratase family protein n=1 Tax=Polynucleobacter sp. es-MAR-4 TaxID=1855655 RepID=UPI001C0CDB4F|nr:SDR family oxidoreductase [Polynucleobacter sp. es-MAR-4]MBU3637572.1 SDR family oxidoreductase [Polynucleobacter sp. es-MAR-4]